MFEDRTYENIMSEMMSKMPDGVNTDEGGLIWNACAKQALMLEEAYLAMQYLEDNLYADTQDEEHLILNGLDKGILIREATRAIVKGVFFQPIEIGTRFTANDLNYTVLEMICENVYKLECEESGTLGNIAKGELSPIDFVEGYQGGAIEEVLIPGKDQEDIEEYRERILSLKDVNYYGGNRADYVRFLEEIPGVGAAKVKRRTEGDAFIRPFILDSEYSVPTAELLHTVQTLVDPEENHGGGDGIAPIGHSVRISAAEEVEINVSLKITYDSGYSYEDLGSYVEEAVDSYFFELKKAWKLSDFLIVRISQIESRVLKIEGILDVTDTALNGGGSNVVLGYHEIPIRGTVDEL